MPFLKANTPSKPLHVFKHYIYDKLLLLQHVVATEIEEAVCLTQKGRIQFIF